MNQETNTSVALTVTVHQPDERLAGMIEQYLPELVVRYTAIIARCSFRTHPTIVQMLRRHEVEIHPGEDKPETLQNIGAVRKEALEAGLQVGSAYLQLCDFDRAIHWIGRFPHELDQVLAEIANYDLLVLGRTARAWATHPPYQSETEPLFNRVFALVTGLPWDIGAGSRGFSRRAAEMVLEQSREDSVGTDAEWPLLALNQDGFHTGFRACEGLEFETADRFWPEIEASGGYQAWEAQISTDPQQWVFRMELALLIARAALHYGQDNRHRIPSS